MGPSIPDLWEVIGKITSGFTLLALIIVVILYLYKIQSDSRLKLLEGASGDEKIKIIQTLSEIYDIPLSGLSQRQQFSILMEQLKQRKQQYMLKIFSLIIFIGLFFIATIVSIYKYNSTQPNIIDVVNDSNPHTIVSKTQSKPISEQQKNNDSVSSNPIVNVSVAKDNNAVSEKNNNIDSILNEPRPAVTAPVEPRTVNEYIKMIKSSKSPIERNNLRTKARTLLAPQFNFGEISTNIDQMYDKQIALYKFKSYDPQKNILTFYQSVQSYSRRPDVLYVDIEADVEIDLNKIWYISRFERGSFSISCNTKNHTTCLSYSFKSGSCPKWIKTPFPQCLAETTHGLEQTSYLFYDDSEEALKKLYNVLLIEIEGISGFKLK